MFYRKPLPALLLATTALAGFGGPAIAQANASAAAPAAPINGEIIVTAQKRSESIQKVPISIQAITTEKLDQLHVASFNDYTKQLPSVTFQTTQPGSTSVYIRGVASGGDGNHSGSLPSVGTYLDEQPITTIGGTLDVHIYDIARIEALSGPQGTLFGASSESGTLRIITNQPDTSHAYGAVNGEVNTLAHGGQGGTLEGFVNLPVNDTVAVRLVGFYQHDAGFIDNVHSRYTFIGAPTGDGIEAAALAAPRNEGTAIPPGYGPGITVDNAKYAKHDFNDVNTFGGRGALKINLNDNWTATASVIGQEMSEHGIFGYDPSVGRLQVESYQPNYDKDRFIQGALTIQGKIGSWDLTYAGGYMWRKINSAQDYSDYSEAYDTLYASYGGLANYAYYKDNAGNPIAPLQEIYGKDTFNKLSQEVRLSSPVEEPFRIVGGLFYQRQAHHIIQDYKVQGLADNLSVNGHPGTLWLTDQDRVDRDYAAFGEASYDIFHNLTLTGGLRYYKYDNSLVGFYGFGRNPDGKPYNAVGSSGTGVASCYNTDGTFLKDNPGGTLAPAYGGLGPCTDLGVFENGKIKPKHAKDDGFIHRLNLTWKVTPDKMIYATWSRGFRPGGINRVATLAPYKADFLTNYEVGWKTTWFDHKLRWNGSLFWEDWKHFQYSFLGPNSFTEIHNGPSARVKGIETDISVTPVRGLTLSATGAYIDSKLRDNLCASDQDSTADCSGDGDFIVAPKGTRMPVTPKLKFSTTARYEFPVADGTGHLQAVINHQSKASSALRVGTNEVEAPPELGAYTTADFAVGWDWKAMSMELFVDNAFDTLADISVFQKCGACTRNYYVVLPPRTIGFRAGYKF
jgi:outer membrane receptor protein involved in Fe transport